MPLLLGAWVPPNAADYSPQQWRPAPPPFLLIFISPFAWGSLRTSSRWVHGLEHFVLRKGWPGLLPSLLVIIVINSDLIGSGGDSPCGYPYNIPLLTLIDRHGIYGMGGISCSRGTRAVLPMIYPPSGLANW